MDYIQFIGTSHNTFTPINQIIEFYSYITRRHATPELALQSIKSYNSHTHANLFYLFSFFLFSPHRFIKNETGRAILRVISGTRQFKIVLFCRLTPIPFGLQNTIFGISSVKSRNYHAATLLGLLPAQIINVYFGTKLKYIHDVFNDHHTQLASYGVFVMEVLIGVGLMLWIVHKARYELSNALIGNKEVDESLLIEVETSQHSGNVTGEEEEEEEEVVFSILEERPELMHPTHDTT